MRAHPVLVTAALGLWFAACGGASGVPGPAPTPAEGEAHRHDAPHGGALVELGDHLAQMEVVVEAATGALTVYVLEAEAEQSVRIAQPSLVVTLEDPALPGEPFTLAPVVSALTGETAGDSSQFAAVITALQGATRVTGRVTEIAVKGRTFRDVAFVVEKTQ